MQTIKTFSQSPGILFSPCYSFFRRLSKYFLISIYNKTSWFVCHI